MPNKKPIMSFPSTSKKRPDYNENLFLAILKMDKILNLLLSN